MRRTTRSTWIVAGVILAAALVMGPISLFVIGLGVGKGFFVGLLMAALPVPFYVAFALWVDRFESEPPWLLVLAFVWGAAIAVFFSMLFNIVHQGVLVQIAGAASASTLTAVIGAPFIEELTKGAALFLLFLWKRDHFDNVTDGIVYASMIGLGFAMTENVQYYGEAVLHEGSFAAAVFFLRGILGPFSHPLFTSMTGIGLGLARESRKTWVKCLAPAAGLLAAMLLHSLWNLSASQGPAFFAAYVLVMIPAFIAVVVIAIYSLRREANMIRIHLQNVIEDGVLSHDDIATLTSVTRRISAASRALFQRGFGQWRARRRFHALATELAFHSWRTTREGTADARAIHAELCDEVRAARATLTMLLVAMLFFAPAVLADTKSYWVSPSGNDANAGTEALPFRTLEQSMAAIRAAGKGDSITVYLADGTYRLTRPLTFGPRGPEVAFRALPGAHPIISGAVQVTGWTLHDKAHNIHRASVGTNYSRQLYVDGNRATRARTDVPNGNNPAGFLPSPILPDSTAADQPYVIKGGIRFRPTSLNPAGWRNPAKWTNPRDIEAVIKTQWKMMIVPLAGITPSSGKKPGLLEMRQPAWTYANLYFQNKTNSCEPDKPGIWSFWQVTRFENAYEFLDEPGEFYLDKAKGALYYIPRPGEDLATADVELPVLETLVEGMGTADLPVANLSFDGLTFAYATWHGPAGDEGYVSDQSGFRVTGSGHRPNVVGHVQDVARTHGNLRFQHAHNISFTGNTFTHLGGAALDFGPGSQHNEIRGNTFADISSAAVQLGGVSKEDARPDSPAGATKHNTISNNLIYQTGRELVDSAAIFVGFSSRTEVSHNTISHVPWAGIAIGWGWGLLDPGSFPGLDCGVSGMWGTYTTPTINSRNMISYNRISHFLEDRWDGGAIYSTGQQGPSMADPLVIEGNVADHKTPGSGGNTFYTDGGSRYVLLKSNVSYDNPIGRVNLGPPPQAGDPLPYSPLPSALNFIPYGGDSGGCRTYGDIHYENNYWMEGIIPIEERLLHGVATLVSDLLRLKPPFELYSKQGFFNVCPYRNDSISYPTRLTYAGNHDIRGEWDVPKAILNKAGIQP